MSEIVRTSYQGLLLADPRWTTDDVVADSSVTQSTPVAGLAAAEGTTALEFRTSGEGVTLTDDVRLQVVRAGMPGAGGATFAWRKVAVGQDYRGWDAPQVLTSSVWIEHDDTIDWRHDPHAVALSDGTVLIACCRDKQTTSTYIQNPDETWASMTDVYTPVAAFTVARGSHPCLAVTRVNDVERALCFFWYELADASYQVALAYSDDKGATWTLAQRGCLAEPISTTTQTPAKLRAAVVGGRVLLLAGVVTADWNEVRQYASSDGGASFLLVDTLTDAPHGFPEVVAVNGVFITATIDNLAVSPYTQPVVRRITSPFQLLSAADPVAVSCNATMSWAEPVAAMSSGTTYTAGELAMWVDDDGSLYLAGLDFNSKAEGLIARSQDGGLSWSAMGSATAAPANGGTWWNSAASDIRPAEFCAVAARGQVLVVHRNETNGILAGQARYALMLMTLGGYSTITFPVANETATDAASQGCWSTTWAALDLPEASTGPWTKVTGGTPTVTLGSAGMTVTYGNVADTASWRADLTTTYAEGAVAVLDLRVPAMGMGFVMLTLSDGTHGYSVRVTVTPTAIVLRDMLGSTDRATVTTTDGASGVQVMLALGETGGGTGNDGLVHAWYRTRTNSDRQWTAIGNYAAIVRGSAVNSRVQWGALAGYASGEVEFSLAAVAAGSDTGVQLYNGQTNPDQLQGRPLATVPQWVTGGLHVAGVAGPGMGQDTFLVEKAAAYPLTNALAEPSPQRTWRSVDTSTDQVVVWTLATVGTSKLLSPVLGLYAGAINWRTGTLHGKNALGTWVKLADIDTAAGQSSLAWTRSGTMITPNGSGTTRWFAKDELRGGYMDLDGVVVKITANEPGMWTAGTQQLRILVASIDGVGSSGTAGAILPSSCALTLPSNTAYKAFKLTITAQTTAEGYLETGVLVFGSVFLFAYPYSWGRAKEWAPLFELVEGRRGTRSARRLTTRARRAVELPWDDEIRERPVVRSSGVPDYVAITAGGTPWGVPADTPHSIGGVLERLSGPVDLCVYLPRLETGGTLQTLNHPQQSLYGRIRSETWRIDAVQGTERDNEVWRGSKVRIEEEL